MTESIKPDNKSNQLPAVYSVSGEHLIEHPVRPRTFKGIGEEFSAYSPPEYGRGDMVLVLVVDPNHCRVGNLASYIDLGAPFFVSVQVMTPVFLDKGNADAVAKAFIQSELVRLAKLLEGR